MLIVIGALGESESSALKLQDFVADGERFIPVFSDKAHFAAEAKGTGYEDQGIEIDRKLLASILKGDEVLVLNPGTVRRRIGKRDLQADKPLL